ncbi:NAD(P)H-dependent oxidoreductase [Limosilactobacillus fermentum]|uniref:NADPH-dependent FMN reductase n=1 Tax=Limosilactobacillus fermentum TaxID=1613 RepID=UPI0021A7B4F6|nr:NADPH-dependent FMN reductase [Limosilactobacillus fermentum]MCT3448712.1 NAD(P)H-dependent oxidoreductase [Limosilactobacillus fermentum]MCT3453016.1 NAD(P)H-dependent oxidoreductase [Limosilactobacillus fermentum]MCT3458914.1 NAD(P)H-dependent oxidoreductase [Limosilactobacillus fermentum]
MKHYIGIAGTNRQGSTNRRLLQFIKEHFADKAEIELMDIGGLPVFYKTPDRLVPERVTEMAKKIEASDGVIISTPEYDHGVPAVLMNALEWLSYGVHPFADKPVMITGASYGMLGTSRAQLMLRQMLDSPELSARIMPSSEYMVGHSLQAFDDEGNLKEGALVNRLDGLFADFDTFVDVNKNLVYDREHVMQDIRVSDLKNDL